jgi:hypothetical protein
MAYIESHQSLLMHRKTGRLARRLGVSRVCAVGHLHAFWWWCIDNAQDGELQAIEPTDIAEGACWEGEPEAFLAALEHAGFVDREGERLLVHEWWEREGRMVLRRQEDAERKRRDRALVGAGIRGMSAAQVPDVQSAPTGRPPDIQSPSAGHPPDVRGMSAARIEKKRGDQRREDQILSPGDHRAGGGVGEESAPAAADATLERPGKSTKPRPIYAEDEPPMVLARRLSGRILANKPDARVPKTPAQLQGWARELDLMLRVDKRSPPEVEAVIDWCQAEPFWCAVILSAEKLRQKFDQLHLQRARGAHAATRRRGARNARWRGGPEVGTDEYYIEAARRLGLPDPRSDPGPEGDGSAA